MARALLISKAGAGARASDPTRCTTPCCSPTVCRCRRAIPHEHTARVLMSTPRGPDGDVSSPRAGIVTPGRTFEERARHAIADVELQQALENLGQRLFTARDVERDHGALKDRA